MRIRNWFVPFLFLILSLVIMAQWGHTVDFETNMSSNSTNTSSLAVINGADAGDILGSVLINTRGGSETFKIYDSSGSANGLLGTINVSTSAAANVAANATANEYVYNLRISSSITISKSGASSDVTVIWKNVR